MKMLGKGLEFISRIKRDGSGTEPVSKTYIEDMAEEKLELQCLSLSKETWIASAFNSFVVKIKKLPNEQEDKRSVARDDASSTLDGQTNWKKEAEYLNQKLKECEGNILPDTREGL